MNSNTALKLKVCGMKFPENISDLVKLDIDYIGFIFYDKSQRYVGDILKIKELTIPFKIIKTGVFVNSEKEYIDSKIELFGLQAVQLHGNESPDICSYYKDSGLIVIKSFSIDEDFNYSILNKYKKVCDYFLFDTTSKKFGGSGKKFNWAILDKYDNSKAFFLAGGISSIDEKMVQSVLKYNVHAIDLNSRFEIAPGLKNIELLKVFIENIKKSNI